MRKHSGDFRRSVKGKCFSTQSSTDGQMGQTVQLNIVSLKWLHFCMEAGPDRCFHGAMLDCPGTFEQAFENATFLSLVIHLEEHILSSAS